MVLLVDDDPNVLRPLARSIQASPFTVVPCRTAHEAIKHVASGAVVAVVSDISMPEISGMELLRILRQHDADIPVILVTGAPSIQTAADAVEFGAFMYHLKPVDPVVLTMSIERAVRHYCSAKIKRETLDSLGIESEATNLRRLQAQYEQALDALWIAYQPIVCKDGSVLGHEAFLRCEGSLLEGPELVISAAERVNDLNHLGRVVRELATKPFLDDRAGLLFINLHPHDLEDPDLYDRDSALASLANRVVLEMAERESLLNIDGFEHKMDALRELGFRIAVDDLGAGYAGLNSIATLEPEFIKLDMTLVRDIEKQPVKQKVVASLTALSKDMGHQVIAEGVETCAERDTLIELGCDFYQGYLISRPTREFPPVNWPPVP